jgi:coenzyme F420-reducing hydrogenase beta subunit
MYKHIYAARNKNYEILEDSRSGGFFSCIATYIIQKNGAVYGCLLDVENRAIHGRIDSVEELNKLRKSKYVQSNMGDIYEQVLEDLKQDRPVLFSGMACQTRGVELYIQNVMGYRPDHLYTLNILCYGVPSPILWNDYLKYKQNKFHGNANGVQFRNKNIFGWSAHIETFVINNKIHASKDYTSMMYGCDAIRPSCYKCTYSYKDYPADITIGDAWGTNKVCPTLRDDKGMSLILTNTQRVEALVEEVLLSSCEYVELTGLDQCYQPRLYGIANEESNDRRVYWETYYKSFDILLRKYGKEKLPLKEQIIGYLQWIKRVLKGQVVWNLR